MEPSFVGVVQIISAVFVAAIVHLLKQQLDEQKAARQSILEIIREQEKYHTKVDTILADMTELKKKDAEYQSHILDIMRRMIRLEEVTRS